MNENDGLHLIPVGNKVYHAEMYIKDTEMKKVEIKEAVRQLELYFEQNKKILNGANSVKEAYTLMTLYIS